MKTSLYNTYEVIFTYQTELMHKYDAKPIKGYTVVKARSHQQAKKLGHPVGVWVTSIRSRLVK